MKEPKEEADRIIEMFSHIAAGDYRTEIGEAFKEKYKRKGRFTEVLTFAKEYNTKQCAILHVEGIIESSLRTFKLYQVGANEIGFYKEVLQIIKDK